jgi:hypothetical protein
VATVATEADGSGTTSQGSSSSSAAAQTDAEYQSDTSIMSPSLKVVSGSPLLSSDTLLLLNSQGDSSAGTKPGISIFTTAGDLVFWQDSGDENASNLTEVSDGENTLLA